MYVPYFSFIFIKNVSRMFRSHCFSSVGRDGISENMRIFAQPKQRHRPYCLSACSQKHRAIAISNTGSWSMLRVVVYEKGE